MYSNVIDLYEYGFLLASRREDIDVSSILRMRISFSKAINKVKDEAGFYEEFKSNIFLRSRYESLIIRMEKLLRKLAGTSVDEKTVAESRTNCDKVIKAQLLTSINPSLNISQFLNDCYELVYTKLEKKLLQSRAIDLKFILQVNMEKIIILKMKL